MPRPVITKMVAKTPAMSKFRDAVINSSPRPLVDKKNSAATMPTSARPLAWRIPVRA